MEKSKDYGFLPLNDRILVLPMESEKVTSSGIIIPDTAQEPKNMGIVVTLGTGLSDKPFLVKVGDMVMYSKYAGTDIELEGDELKVLRESDVIGIKQR